MRCFEKQMSMNYHYMNRNELIDELQKLQKEYDSLKAFSEKKIEDCRRTEEALHDSEERFRLILENSGEAFLLTNPDGSIYSANPERRACKYIHLYLVFGLLVSVAPFIYIVGIRGLRSAIEDGCEAISIAGLAW